MLYELDHSKWKTYVLFIKKPRERVSSVFPRYIFNVSRSAEEQMFS